MDYIRTFDAVGRDDVGLVGGKGANLGEMTRAGLPVPPGFCVTAEAYRSFLTLTGADVAIREILAGMPDDPAEVDARAERIRACFTTRAMPEEIAAQTLAAYHALSLKLGETSGAQGAAPVAEPIEPVAGTAAGLVASRAPVGEAVSATAGEAVSAAAGESASALGAEAVESVAGTATGPLARPVAVRSSATAEDLPTASFAGQQDTYLNVRGDADLLEHVKQCWASLWTGRAVSYRTRQGYAHELVALSVVVQAMIESEVAGIMFTANPVNGSRTEAVINASWGLGEAIVSGLVTPDTLSVRKRDGAILERQIASKDILIQYAPQGGTVELPVAPERRSIPALSDAQVAELVRLSALIEAHYKTPMDIEWGYRAGQFYILQARPITTLKAMAEPVAEPGARSEVVAEPVEAVAGALLVPGEYNRTMFIEIFPDPLSPVFLSVLQPLFHSMLAFTFETLGFTPPRDVQAIGIFYSQVYFSRGYIEAALQPLSPSVRAQLVAQIINPFGRHAKGVNGELSPAYLGMVVRLLRFMTGFPAQLPGVIATYRAGIANFRQLDLGTLTDKEIVERSVALALSTASALLNYDFLMIALIGITYQTLGTLLQPYYGDDSEEIRSKLISGVTGNVTMETNKRLWDLAMQAKQSPTIVDALRSPAKPAGQVNAGDALSGQFTGAGRTQLADSPEGAAFLTSLSKFLDEFGHREVRMDILYPTWGEDPSPVLAFLRGYLDVPESQSPYHQQTRLVQQRAELGAEVKARVRSDLRGRLLIWPVFAWVLKHTQTHTRERDTMHFELTRLFPALRAALLEVGRRWSTAGMLAAPDDIFYLSLNELPVVAESHQPQQALVRARRAELEANRLRPAPGILRDGLSATAQEAAPVAAGAPLTASQLRGIAGSPGLVTGVARLVRGPEDFNKLKSGEILVAPLTNPVWTPLFAIARGIVTEIGGILSHGAIVAREYGLPAVMGVAGATTAIVEGRRVTVDGNRGIVTLEPE